MDIGMVMKEASSGAASSPSAKSSETLHGRRWEGIQRPYSKADVDRLRGSLRIAHTLADLGARRLWELLHTEDYVAALGALTGNQAVQMVRAGLKAIYLSGWQVAADANSAGQMYPDQSLYPVDSVPTVVKRINQAFRRADQIEHSEGKGGRYWFAPIVADAEAGFGGPLNAFELMKSLIEAGAAGVHFEDQLASEKKCGHMGGKVLVPTAQFIRTLVAARLAADVCDVPTLLVARTDADSAKLLLSDVDPRDREFIVPGERTAEGFYRMRTSSGARRPPPIWRRRGSSPRRSTPGSPTSSWPTTARRHSTGRRTSTTPPSPASRGSWGRWGTSSSSSPWPGSTPSTSGCSTSPGTTPRKEWRPTAGCSRRSSAPRTPATPPPGTSGRSEPPTSTTWHR